MRIDIVEEVQDIIIAILIAGLILSLFHPDAFRVRSFAETMAIPISFPDGGGW